MENEMMMMMMMIVHRCNQGGIDVGRNSQLFTWGGEGVKFMKVRYLPIFSKAESRKMKTAIADSIIKNIPQAERGLKRSLRKSEPRMIETTTRM